jgi:putative spermidine/putrescine transport system permease protein
MWLYDAGHVPLPMMMISLISRMFDPGIAAIASLMILFSLVMVLALEKIAGLRRAMSF